MRVKCPDCDRVASVKSEFVGKRVRFPCGHTFRIPSPDSQERPASPEASRQPDSETSEPTESETYSLQAAPPPPPPPVEQPADQPSIYNATSRSRIAADFDKPYDPSFSETPISDMLLHVTWQVRLAISGVVFVGIFLIVFLLTKWGGGQQAFQLASSTGGILALLYFFFSSWSIAAQSAGNTSGAATGGERVKQPKLKPDQRFALSLLIPYEHGAGCDRPNVLVMGVITSVVTGAAACTVGAFVGLGLSGVLAGEVQWDAVRGKNFLMAVLMLVFPPLVGTILGLCAGVIWPMSKAGEFAGNRNPRTIAGLSAGVTAGLGVIASLIIMLQLPEGAPTGIYLGVAFVAVAGASSAAYWGAHRWSLKPYCEHCGSVYEQTGSICFAEDPKAVASTIRFRGFPALAEKRTRTAMTTVAVLMLCRTDPDNCPAFLEIESQASTYASGFVPDVFREDVVSVFDDD